MALLATHQEEQEELYNHIRSVVPDGRLPVRQRNTHYFLLTYLIRAIKMFHNSREFSPSSTKHFAFVLR